MSIPKWRVRKKNSCLGYSTVIQCIYEVLLPSIGITISLYILGSYQPTSIVECNKGIFTAQRGAMKWHWKKNSLTFRNLACPFVRFAWEMCGLLEKVRGVCKLHRYLVFRHSSRWGDPPFLWLWKDCQNMLVLEPSASCSACGTNGMSQTCKKCLDKKT